MNVSILCNEDAGRSLSDQALRDLITKAGHCVVDLVDPKGRRTRPVPAAIDLVVAAGGDGTVASAADLVNGTSTALAILSLGTANNIAAGFGLSRDVPQLIDSWRTGRRVPFDLGRVRAGTKGWTIVEGVGGGLIPAGIAAAHRALDGADAHPSVEIDAAVRLFYDILRDLPPARRTLTMDGQRVETELILLEVLNIRSIGPNLVLAPDADPSDGWFDVVLAEPSHRTELLQYLESCLDKSHRRLSLPRHRARQVRIDSCEELHIDDERVDTCGLGALDIAIAPGAITVLMPS